MSKLSILISTASFPGLRWGEGTDNTGVGTDGGSWDTGFDTEYGTTEQEFQDAIDADNELNGIGSDNEDFSDTGDNFGNNFGYGSYEDRLVNAQNTDAMFDTGYTQALLDSQPYGPLGPNGTMSPSQETLSNAVAGFYSEQNLSGLDLSRSSVLFDTGFTQFQLNSFLTIETTSIVDFLGAFMSDVRGRPAYAFSVTYTAPPYKESVNVTYTQELTASMFGNTLTTTRSVPNMLGGYTTDQFTDSFIDSHDTYVTNMKGEIVSHDTAISIGNTTAWSYDTHYWKGTNQQFGFVAEVTADTLEMFGVKTNTVRTIAAVVEVASILLSIVMPNMQAFGTFMKAMQVNKAIGIIGAIGSLLSIYEALDDINNMFTGEEWNDPNTTLSNSMMNTFGLGNGEKFELGDVVNDTITSEYYPMLIGAGQMKSDSAMLPQIHNQSQLIKPTINKEENMQSQQAVFVDYRGGLSEVLASNLIGANEGSIYENIDITKGTMQSKKLGTVTTGFLNEYVIKLPNDYSFHSEFKFSSCKQGNFIYITVEDDVYPYIYQLDYQTLDRDCDETDLVQASLTAPTSNPTVVDSLVSKVIVAIDTKDDDSPVDATDNVKTGDYIAIYYGSTEVKRSGAMTAANIAASVIEVVLDLYYAESEEDQFSYKIIRGSTVIDPESNNLTLTNEDELESELWEEYVYVYTYYDSTSGFESAPLFSDSFLKKTQTISIESLEYTDQANVDYIRVYRIGGYSSSYRLIAEIDNIVGTGSTVYVDSLSEEYTPSLLDTQNLAIVENLIGLIEHKGSLFAYKNNQVYFSRPGKPNMWSNFNSIRVGGTISGVASTPLGVLIFTDNSQTYLLGGTDKYNFTLSTLTKTIGCVSNRSIANYKNTAIWLDYEGLMISVGSSVSNISKEKVDLTEIGDIIESIVYDSVYYLIGTNYSLLVDFRYNTPSFQKVVGIEHIHYHKGKIYTQIDGVLYENSFAKVGDYMTMSYKAPMFIGNSYDILTEFNKINITFKGDFTYKIYIDEIEVSTNTISSVGIKVEELKLPSNYNEGLGLELKLIGTGEIKSFRYIFNNVNTN